MRRKRLSMRTICEVLRLKAAGLGVRQIARSCGLARSTVSDYIRRASEAGVSWPLPDGIGDADLDRQLFREPDHRERDDIRPLPDWSRIHTELRRKGVTLKLLWQEYRETHPEGYGYSQYCEYYRRWAGSVDVTMRQVHRAGEKLFVDYAGLTVPIHAASGGPVIAAQVFVSTLGASSYLYAEATRTQQLHDWIGAHVRAFEHIGGVPRIVVPDNLKSGVSRACRYDPELNPAYAEMAAHYGVAVVPARPHKPRDKAKVETGVQIVEREVLAPLRDCRFFSIAALNRAMRGLLDPINSRPLRKLDVSRRTLLDQLERPALGPLPSRRYEYAQFLSPKVSIDYHVEILGHCYSVPCALRGQRVDVRLTAHAVEVLHGGRRVASHARSGVKGGHTTDPAHMPESHRRHLEWSPSRIIRWAGSVGPHCAQVAQQIIESRAHPEQGYRACLGILRLSKSYSDVRVEAACRRALALDVCTYRSIHSILKTGADAEPLPADEPSPGNGDTHRNIRGKTYYHTDNTRELIDA